MQKASVSPNWKKPWPFDFMISSPVSNWINWDNPGVCNILRAREMSLKPFRDKKNSNYYRPMQKARVYPNWKKPWPYEFMINFLGEMEFNRENPSVSNILSAREMSLKPWRDTKIWITIARCGKRAWVPIGRNSDHKTLWSIFLGQTEFNRDNPGSSNILKVRDMSLKPFWDTKIWNTVARCRKRVWVPIGRNRDHTNLWSIFLCQK